MVPALLLGQKSLRAYAHLPRGELLVLIVVYVELDRLSQRRPTTSLPGNLFQFAVRPYIVLDRIERDTVWPVGVEL